MRRVLCSSSRGRRSESGFALLIVLWTVFLLSLLITHLTAAGRSEARLAGNLRLEATAEAAADGAVMEAIFHSIDTSDRHWPADGAPHRIAAGGADVVLRIDNEAGKINPNIAQPELFAALLHAVDVDSRAAAAITGALVAWRFPNAEVAPGENANAYREVGRNYGPPGGALESVRELSLVLGMTPDILSRIAPFLSIFNDGAPDPRSAAQPVLRALREASGEPPALAQGVPPESVVSITATATAPDGGGFARRAVVRIGARATAAGLYQVLIWERL